MRDAPLGGLPPRGKRSIFVLGRSDLSSQPGRPQKSPERDGRRPPIAARPTRLHERSGPSMSWAGGRGRGGQRGAWVPLHECKPVGAFAGWHDPELDRGGGRRRPCGARHRLPHVPDRSARMDAALASHSRIRGIVICLRCAFPTTMPCAYRKSNPDIFVVQSAEDWAAKNSPCPLHGAR